MPLSRSSGSRTAHERERLLCNNSSFIHSFSHPLIINISSFINNSSFKHSFVGETFDLSHVTGAGGNSSPHVSLQVLSLTPRVFELHHFFTRDESTELIERALQETRETHRIKRSSTGATGYNVNPQRTSESGYDTSGTTAVAIMQYVTTKK